MTLKEIEMNLFPAIYKMRNGQLVEITGFAFTGILLNENSNSELVHVWDREMNAVDYGSIHTSHIEEFDCMELVKSPTSVEEKKKFVYHKDD